jgi:hypothetical protein
MLLATRVRLLGDRDLEIAPIDPREAARPVASEAAT